MRLYAKTIGFSLSDLGLFPTRREYIDGKMNVRKEPSLEAKTEEEVFALLGLNYVPPKNRSCYDDVVTVGQSKKDIFGSSHQGDKAGARYHEHEAGARYEAGDEADEAASSP